MIVFIKSVKRGINASGDYDPETNALVVFKGSIVSDFISTASTFRGAKTVEKYRREYVQDRVLTEDVAFKSPSTAANFITGSSTDGMKVWKTDDGSTIAEKMKMIFE